MATLFLSGQREIILSPQETHYILHNNQHAILRVYCGEEPEHLFPWEVKVFIRQEIDFLPCPNVLHNILVENP